MKEMQQLYIHSMYYVRCTNDHTPVSMKQHKHYMHDAVHCSVYLRFNSWFKINNLLAELLENHKL